MGEGRGDESGKWIMGATLSRVVAAGPVLDNCGFLRPPLGKWMGAALSRVVAAAIYG